MIEQDLQRMYSKTNMKNVKSEEKIIPRNTVEMAIQDECHRVTALLIEKNRSYGNSALNPVRVFSKSDTTEQLKVRIDDKLSRFMNGDDTFKENDLDDLMGYLVLLSIAVKETWK
jgi:hypothetical protein